MARRFLASMSFAASRRTRRLVASQSQRRQSQQHRQLRLRRPRAPPPRRQSRWMSRRRRRRRPLTRSPRPRRRRRPRRPEPCPPRRRRRRPPRPPRRPPPRRCSAWKPTRCGCPWTCWATSRPSRRATAIASAVVATPRVASTSLSGVQSSTATCRARARSGRSGASASTPARRPAPRGTWWPRPRRTQCPRTAVACSIGSIGLR
mmetsp:Transcript_88657/g.255767  ORF Transcript_88657/g.255767 Transcript_88657/m.255767 type:complete len:205 (-) Transcript_88657:644-1258(-)